MIQKVAVIGAGVMGSGIAAQLANNNVPVLLFDLKNDGVLIATKALEKMLTSNSQLVDHSVASLIKACSLEDDLSFLNECDLIIEAIVEKLDIKQNFYQNAAIHLKDGAIISSNTSTFQLAQLTDGLSEKIKSKMCICHFFNPPRYMRLLELIIPSNPDFEIDVLENFLTHRIGKEVIICKDQPGFIANRIGCYLMELTLNAAIDHKMQPASVDALFTSLIGFPSTGIFGLYDLIGLDVMRLIGNSLAKSLDKDDDFHRVNKKYSLVEDMVRSSRLGRKSGEGFYKIATNQTKTKLQLELTSMEYIDVEKPVYSNTTLREFLNSSSRAGIFARDVLFRFFEYVLTIQEEIAHSATDIDKAIKLGYAWKYGPFELMELAGYEFDVNGYDKSHSNIAHAFLSGKHKLLEEKNSHRIWQLNEQNICFEIRTKLNILGDSVFLGLQHALAIAETNNRKLIIYSDSKNFSAGADLKYFLEANILDIEKTLILGQETMQRLKYAKIPVISCAKGVALGGGCEILLHSDYIIAHQELNAGLVETSIGLIPGWGGLKEMILRSGNIEELQNNFDIIISHFKSCSAINFARKFKLDNIVSLARLDDIPHYALNSQMSAQKTNMRSEINIPTYLDYEKYAVTDQYEIAKSLSAKLFGTLTEQDLLDIEREVFLVLVKSEDAISKIKSVTLAP